MQMNRHGPADRSWGLYGYIVMYRFTKDEEYLALAQ